MNATPTIEHTRTTTATIELGIYEKALKWTGTWPSFFAQAATAGFSFVDISIDETPERQARLHWNKKQRDEVRQAAHNAGIKLGGLCLSLHRRIAPGSSDPHTRAQATQALIDGIDLAADLHIPVLQLAGYFAYYETPHPQNRQWYVECLRTGAAHAATRGILLGIENVDGTDITSISTAMHIVNEIDSPWLQLYPDIGNIAEQGLNITSELRRGRGHMLALHAKDVRPGEPRRVPMGTGIVNWDEAFTELAAQNWTGRMMIEMWNDEADNSAQLAATARQYIH
ncbi:L-ribulose-5-phosphate 3-epimerase, partial [Dermatophilus congolensis]